jgi:cytochrome P450
VLIKAFSPANLLHFQPTFVERTRDLFRELETSIATGQSVDMNFLFNALTLDVMVDVGFGDQVDREDREKILHAFRYLMSETQNPIHDIPVLKKLPFGSAGEVNRQFAILRQTAEKIVRERRLVFRTGRASGVHQGKYIIDLLIDARESDGDAPLSDLEVRDNTIALLLAGSETTGTSLTWAIENFFRHPEHLAEILEENAKSGLDWDSLAHVTNLDQELPVLTKNLNESLRVRPSLSGLPQRIFREAGSVGDLDLPKGSRVGCALWLVHQNPEYWPQPDKYDPSRFEEDQVEARHPFSFLPFGKGRRQCLGKTFAMNEMRVVLSLVLKSVP